MRTGRKLRQIAYKPGSVLGKCQGMAIHLGHPLPDASRNLPGRQARKSASTGEPVRTAPIWSCSRWGLPCRYCCQQRGALLPHPFTLTDQRFKSPTGGLLSVALSLRSPSPGVTRHRISAEPGLSSAYRQWPSSDLAHHTIYAT